MSTKKINKKIKQFVQLLDELSLFSENEENVKFVYLHRQMILTEIDNLIKNALQMQATSQSNFDIQYRLTNMKDAFESYDAEDDTLVLLSQQQFIPSQQPMVPSQLPTFQIQGMPIRINPAVCPMVQPTVPVNNEQLLLMNILRRHDDESTKADEIVKNHVDGIRKAKADQIVKNHEDQSGKNHEDLKQVVRGPIIDDDDIPFDGIYCHSNN